MLEPLNNNFSRELSAPTKKLNFSEYLYGIDWSKHFPTQFATPAGPIDVEFGSYEQAKKFLNDNYLAIYGDDSESAFVKDEFSEARSKYYEQFGDFIALLKEGKVVGVYVGTPIDWNSYYFRFTALLPEVRGLGLLGKITEKMLSVVSSVDIHRVEGDISPGNLPHIHTLTKLGFNISGINLNDRWGALVHFTKFLKKKNQNVFLDQFCDGMKVQKRNN